MIQKKLHQQHQTAQGELREDGSSVRKSQVVRKFEELRQSIEIYNSINHFNGHKEIHHEEHNIKTQDEGEEGNKQPHDNSFIINFNITKGNEPEDTLKQKSPSMADKVHTQQPVSHKGKDGLKDKDQDVKEEMALKVDHSISLEQLAQKYHTDWEKGMEQPKADELLLLNGENKLTEKKKVSLWVKLFKEMTNGFALMLWASAILCFIAYGLTPEDPSNIYLAVVILIVIGITCGITFQQNAKSEALMNSFKNFLPQKCTVIRGGEMKQIDAVKLVQGDVVLIKAGEKIPADLRILESSEMKVDNSALTGESEPLLRTVECSHPDNYLETTNIAFFGTMCKEGQGKGVVICTGDNTTLGQIADLSSGEKKAKTPLRIELDRFVIMMTVISIFLSVLFFLLSYLYMNLTITACVVLGIGILVANVPEGLLGCITISLSITARALARKHVLVKNLEAVETLGSTSCICTDKTGTLTQNVMSVKHMWYKYSVFNTVNKQLIKEGEKPDYDENDADFKILHQAAMICSEAQFDSSEIKNQDSIDYLTCPVIGDATETGLIRFYQYISDVNTFRSRFQIAKNPDGTISKMPFNSQVKFSLTIIEEETEGSCFTIYIKGAPEKIWSYCSEAIKDGQPVNIDDAWQQKFKEVNLQFGKGGERVLGFAKFHLPISEYPKGTHFVVSSVPKFNFKLANFQFCGLISLMDPPKERVPRAILECRSAGIKVIMVTGDQPPTAAAIAREVNIIPKRVLTNEDLMEMHPSLSWFEASEACDAIVAHGDRIVESINKSIEENRDDQYYYLRQWINKQYCVFARTTPAQKLQIVEACQKENYIVASTGDGVNDSPAIKQADIGISMNISGSDVTKDAADMILLDDDFASIVNGVEEGRKIFDNLKKSIVYLLTSNMTEIIPFLVFIILQIPLPLSSIYMLVIQVGTDIWPAISLAYEEAEIDLMTRRPRSKFEHLVSTKVITIGYLQTGQIASGAGLLGYFVAFNYFGFPITELFGLASKTGYKPPSKDFSTPISPYTSLPDPSFNQRLYDAAPDCRLNKDKSDALSYELDWFNDGEGIYDMRKILVKCNTQTGHWESEKTWSHCDVNSSYTHSPITDVTACYAADAIKWSQTCYFVCVVFFQWSNVFTCKSRKMSFVTTNVNHTMLHGVIFETCLTVFLLFTPGVQKIFGGRPLPFFLYGLPAFCVSISLMLWDEVRKFCCRSSSWFLKFTYW